MGSDTIPKAWLGSHAHAGCDSIINVSLSFFSLDTTFVNDQLCTGQSLTVNGTVYDETRAAPRWAVTLPGGSVAGCDSIINVSLSFFSLDTTFVNNPSGIEVIAGGATVHGLRYSNCARGESLGTVYDETNPSFGGAATRRST